MVGRCAIILATRLGIFMVTYNSEDWKLMENNQNFLLARMMPVRGDTWDMLKGINFYHLRTLNVAGKEHVVLNDKTIAYIKSIRPSLGTEWMGYEIYYYRLKTGGWLVGAGRYFLGVPPQTLKKYEYYDTQNGLINDTKRVLNNVTRMR